jgi:DNA-binding response OmpR family regulator
LDIRPAGAILKTVISSEFGRPIVVVITTEPQLDPLILRVVFDVRKLPAHAPLAPDTAAIVLAPAGDPSPAIRALRDRTMLPMIAVLAREAPVSGRVDALEAGADDVVSAPFDDAELVARVRALIRRAQPVQPLGDDSDLAIDLSRHRVRARGNDVDLSPIEFTFLATLAKQPGLVASPASLSAAAFGKNLSTAMLYTTASMVRRKLQAAGLPEAIRTVRSRGYALTDVTVAEVRQ